MKNCEKYQFKDFTLNHYKEILSLVLKNHIPSFYDSFDKNSLFSLIRHDVDFSLYNALKLSKLEKSLGVQSTYFLMLHSEYYNIFEKENHEIVNTIISMGHRVGLHFDSQFYAIDTPKKINEKVVLEKKVLESLFNTEINCLSFHNPTDFTMNCKDWKYGGLVNTYADYFQANVAYCSDSNGYWRFERMFDFVEKNYNSPIQLLTHPVWWSEDVFSPKQKIYKCIENRMENNKKLYNKTLNEVGRENIDW